MSESTGRRMQLIRSDLRVLRGEVAAAESRFRLVVATFARRPAEQVEMQMRLGADLLMRPECAHALVEYLLDACPWIVLPRSEATDMIVGDLWSGIVRGLAPSEEEREGAG